MRSFGLEEKGVRTPTWRDEEVFVPLRTPRDRVPQVTHVRSTLLALSLRAVRERDRLDAYLAAVPEKHHQILLDAIPGVWVPKEVGMAHYAAIDALALSASEQTEIGRAVADGIKSSQLGTVVKLAHGAGATPWAGLGLLERVWDRLLLGGAVAVYKLGPKEARLEAHGVPFARYDYFRNALRGIVSSTGDLFCTKMYVTQLPEHCGSLKIGLRAAWA